MTTPALMLARLALTDLRNYAALVWHPPRLAVLVGPNGAGKTNLLEAVSLLVPGRGLRGARPADLRRIGAASWAVAGRFETPAGPTEVGTGALPDAPDRRIFRLDGQTARSQAEIGARIAAVWLTPQMDRLFAEAASGRRRFLDRLVWALLPGHARELAAHDHAMAERNRLLAAGAADAAWLEALEDAMARHAVAAAAARRELVARLNAAMPDAVGPAFPAARLVLRDPVAERLDGPALAAEDALRHGLAAARALDRQTGSASHGAHRADFDLVQAATGVPAGLASTGEQRALLVATILAHAALIGAARGFAPILLLDEPGAHLDAARRTALFDALASLPAQVLMTGTDAALFAPLGDRAEVFRVVRGTIEGAAGN